MNAYEPTNDTPEPLSPRILPVRASVRVPHLARSMNNKDREPSHGTVPFVDNRGIERLRLPDNLTLGQLAVMGITLRLEPKDSNHEDGKIVHNPAHYPKE